MADEFTRDCALMSGAVYRSSRMDKNQLPIPNGWVYDSKYDHESLPSGFEASCFVNGNNVVIAFAGTYPRSLNDWGTKERKGVKSLLGSWLNKKECLSDVRMN